MNITRCDQLTRDLELRADVVIVGSGAGGSVLAAGLAKRGLDVVVLEAGPHHTRQDFERVDERWSYPALYQERGARATADLGITVLQGRAIGGGTLINWTTCFRTPERIFEHWRREHGTRLDSSVFLPHWEAVEARLGIHRWATSPNPNNSVLQRGCEALQWDHQILRRNVRGCTNSGLCGLGCPFDAKQAMHLTYLLDATEHGARIHSDVQVTRILIENGCAVGVQAVAMVRGADASTPHQVIVHAPIVVCSGGAINTPALLLRSGLDSQGRVGRRTFLHPVVAVVARHDAEILPFKGAPQSVSSHQFVDRGPDRVGFFLEAAPMQPMLAASSGWACGQALRQMMLGLSHSSVVIGLMVDGIGADDGGVVSVRSDGRTRLDYPVGPTLVEAMRRAHLAAAEVQLAGGAAQVLTTHPQPIMVRRGGSLDPIASAAFGTHRHGIFSAHQMGGCPMGTDPKRHVVDLELRFRGVDNLFVVDGSVLPTALGVNPSQTIYGLAHWITPTIHAAAG